MPHPIKHLRRSIKDSPTLWRLGAGFLVAGITVIYISHKIEAQHGFSSEILRDVGIALCISVFIAFLIEIGLARKMFANGLDAIMEQTVPPRVWDEIRQHVISQPVVRHDFTITMNLAKSMNDYVSTTTLEYTVESLRDALTHHVEHELDAHRNPDPVPCVRYEKISVDNSGLPLQEVVSEDGLKAAYDVNFAWVGDTRKISLSIRELVKATDVISWWMTNPTDGLKVEVNAPADLDCEVIAHHPTKGLHDDPKKKGYWRFLGVMLPGQGFEIQFRPK